MTRPEEHLSQDFMLGRIYERTEVLTQRTRCLPGLVADMNRIKSSGCQAFARNGQDIGQGGTNDPKPVSPQDAVLSPRVWRRLTVAQRILIIFMVSVPLLLGIGTAVALVI